MPLIRSGAATPATAAIAVVLALSNPGTRTAAQDRTAAHSVDWPLHNLDLGGTRYSPLDQINRSNVKSLVPRWLFQHGVIDGVSNQTTPIIVNGKMYVTDSRGSVGATSAISMGYWFTTAPQIYKGVLYIGSTRSESHIPGGHVLAIDARSGKVLWHFNTIPQDEKDQGWEIAGPTWVGGERNGGGIWETPAIDPELGLLYVAVGNPFGDSTKRAGANLFTDSIIALTLNDGRLKWFFQQTHHDVWDYDSGAPPILFDMTVNGRRVKAVAEASKNGFLYILDRETGKPVHPIKEMPVPTDKAGPGESPYLTQPIPYTASGKPMEPVCPIEPRDISPERLARYTIDPILSPRRPNQIIAPGTGGGTNTALCPTARRPACCTWRPSTSPSTRDAGPRATFPHTTRRRAT
jgi:glucose dehydrogenase